MEKDNSRNRTESGNLDKTQTFSFKDEIKDYDQYRPEKRDYFEDHDSRGTYYDDLYEDEDDYDYYSYDDREDDYYENDRHNLKTAATPVKSVDKKPRPNSSTRRTGTSSGKRPPQRNLKKEFTRNQYIAFYLITLLAAIAVCLTVFFAVYNMVSGNNQPLAEDSDYPSSVAEDRPITATNEITTLGMINAKNTAANTVEVLDIENFSTTVFAVDENTVMRSRTGETLTFADFNVGDLVDCRYPETGSVLSSMSISSRVWEQRAITNARINVDNKTIVWGNDSYSYTDHLKVLYNGQNYDIAQIEANNVITLRGLDRTVWYIEVNKGAGILELINAEEIKDGIIEFEGASTLTFDASSEADRRLNVLEGDYKVTVRGANIEDYIANVTIESGRTTFLDLREVAIVAGILNITVNVSDAIVSINDQVVRVNEPQVLNYGTHTIKVQHNNYESYEETIEIDSATQELNITLKEKIEFSEIEITSQPLGGEVYIDDAFIGITPVTAFIDMESNSRRQLTVKKEGYIDTSVNMTRGQARYKIILREDPEAEVNSFLNEYNANSPSEDE